MDFSADDVKPVPPISGTKTNKVMSKVIGNSVVKGAKGLFGDDIVFKKVRGNMVMAKPPAPRDKREMSDKQKAHAKRFLKATQFATRMLANPTTAAEYEGGITLRKFTARLVAISDYLNAPEVDSINTDLYFGNPGDKVIIDATDDFLVKAVKVTITDSTGAVIEQGDAGPDAEDVSPWTYVVTKANASLPGTTIRAVAYDKPGNKGTLEIVM